MRRALLLLVPLGSLLATALIVRERNVPSSQKALESAIQRACATHAWVEPLVSKYVSFPYPSGSKLFSYAAIYRWPGDLRRGLGMQTLNAAVGIANTKYHLDIRGININGAVNDHYINIYFFDPAATPQFERFKRQCAYVGFRNIVLCDARYVFEFQEVGIVEHELDSYLAPGQHFSTLLNVHRPVRVVFLLRDLAATHYTLLWALSHEIGHLAHRHKPLSAAMFLLQPSKSRKIATAMEIEADEFAVETLQASEGVSLVFTGLTDVVGGLIAHALHAPGGELPVRLEELHDRIPVKRSQGNHPPMLIRLLDALAILEKTKVPDFSGQSIPTFARLRSQVYLVP